MAKASYLDYFTASHAALELAGLDAAEYNYLVYKADGCEGVHDAEVMEKALIQSFPESDKKPTIPRKDLIMWARARGHDTTRFEREQDGLFIQGSPAYLDVNNPCYPEELAIAVDVWSKLQDLIPDGESHPKNETPKVALKKMTEKHYPDLSKDKKDRIVIVTNWHKKGRIKQS